jgi:SAM-dependent methyltransferase
MGMVHSHAAGMAASAWVARFAPLAPAGEVLDVACGSGRHALLFAALGHPVLAIDRDAVALQRLADTGAPGITVQQVDLELGAAPAAPFHWPFEADRFAAIVVTNYLHRPLLDSLVASLAPGGMLIYETFARGNERFGKPSNPDFLLLPGELLALAARCTPPLQVIAFEEGEVALPAPAMTQRICAVRPG